MNLASVIVHENERCLLVESPAGVPLVTRDVLGSEGFLSWFLRHQRWLVRESACPRVEHEGRRFALVPKREPSESLPPIEVVPIGQTSKALRHAWLSESIPIEEPTNPRSASGPTWLSHRSTNAYRWDALLGHMLPGGQATRLANAVLYQSERRPRPAEVEELEGLGRRHGLCCGYWKAHERGVQRKGKAELSPELVWGEAELF